MIPPELIYFLKVNVAIALFYAFYRLFFRKDTFFYLRRMILLLFLMVSFLYPFLNFEQLIKSNEPIYDIATLYATVVIPEISAQSTQVLPSDNYILTAIKYIYIIGVILLFIRFISQLISIGILAIKCKKDVVNGTSIRVLQNKDEIEAFSFFGWIFFSKKTLNEPQFEEVLMHEQTHVRQCHSLDVIFSELTCIICWLNPFIWLLKQEVRGNLEYMADRKVVQSGYDSKSYQYHLLSIANHKAAANIYNNFNVLPIKNRIMMMNKKRTNHFGRTKYILFLPLTALLLLISNIEAVARMSAEITNEVFQNTPTKYSGSVTDESGKPVIGANVIIQNTTVGTITDMDGVFVIEAKPTDILFISYIGMETSKVMLTKTNTDIRVTLKTEATEYKGTGASPKRNIEKDGQVFSVVEVMPEFPGGVEGFMEFISNNVKYPEKAHKDGTQGRVIAQFTVEKDGSISNIHIVRSVSPELDAEAIRVLSTMPRWNPGQQRGQPVAVKYTVPVQFKLSDTKDTTSENIESTIPKNVLYIVDGKEVENVKNIKPSQIESISVIKDAVSMAEYNATDKEGIIIIKTIKKY